MQGPYFYSIQQLECQMPEKNIEIMSYGGQIKIISDAQ